MILLGETLSVACHVNRVKINCIIDCMQDGFKSGPVHSHAGATSYSNSYFGRGTGGIFLDNLSCTGRESRLVDCSHSGIGYHNCDHSADAGVRCQGNHSCIHSSRG